jgi:uncharacterized protein YcnI
MPRPRYRLLLAGIAVLAASPAWAHVTLQNREAVVGASYKAVFVVPHGCAGSPTVKLRVQIPEGVIAEEPAPKPGWSVATVKGKYASDYDYQGSKVSEGIKEVTWSGGRLPDHTREEFVLNTYLAGSLKPNSMLYFPTVQECEKGISRWIEIPADGHESHGHDEGKAPAPGVRLMPKP